MMAQPYLPIVNMSMAESLKQLGFADATPFCYKDGILTDYEAKFISGGLKINRLVAVKTAETKTTAAGAVPRLRNASLCDARGFEESRRTNGEKERGE